jgi:hypothetical protein
VLSALPLTAVGPSACRGFPPNTFRPHKASNELGRESVRPHLPDTEYQFII